MPTANLCYRAGSTHRLERLPWRCGHCCCCPGTFMCAASSFGRSVFCVVFVVTTLPCLCDDPTLCRSPSWRGSAFPRKLAGPGFRGTREIYTYCCRTHCSGLLGLIPLNAMLFFVTNPQPAVVFCVCFSCAIPFFSSQERKKMPVQRETALGMPEESSSSICKVSAFYQKYKIEFHISGMVFCHGADL